MDDSFYRKAIIDCASRLIELKPLGSNITVSIPSREYKALLTSLLCSNEDVISTCHDNILVWNVLIHCILSLSSPLIPFELIHKRPITLELAYFVVATMPDENLYPFEMILNAINIILFPDLRVNVENDDSLISEESEMGAYFPNVVSTIGMAICRPVESCYKSILHKQGIDEIGTLLTYILDNRKWLFHLRLPTQPLPSEDYQMAGDNSTYTISPAILRHMVQSGIHSNAVSNPPRTFHEVQTTFEAHDKITAFLEPGPQAHQPLPSSQPPVGMKLQQICELVGNSLQTRPNPQQTPQYNIKTAGEAISEYAPLDGLAVEDEALACQVLQCLIRKVNTRFVCRVIEREMISPVPKPAKHCCFCFCPTTHVDMPYIDFTGYFNEDDWVKASQFEQMNREELLELVNTLQLQMLDVEERLTSSDKKSIILNNPFLMHKYSVYNCIIEHFKAKHYFVCL